MGHDKLDLLESLHALKFLKNPLKTSTKRVINFSREQKIRYVINNQLNCLKSEKHTSLFLKKILF